MRFKKNIELVQNEIDLYLKKNEDQKSLWSLRLKIWIKKFRCSKKLQKTLYFSY